MMPTSRKSWIGLVRVFLVAVTVLAQIVQAGKETSSHRVLVGPLLDTEESPIAAEGSTVPPPVLVVLETTRTLKFEGNEDKFHLYDQFDPLWGELFLTPKEGSDKSGRNLTEVSYSACGGRYRKGWIPTNSSSRSFARAARALQSHATCEFATVSVCSGEEQGKDPYTTFGRVAEKLSSVTSVPLRFTGTTGALRRPLTHLRHAPEFNYLGHHWCGVASSPIGPLCTHNLAPLLADHEHSTHSIFRYFLPSYRLVLGSKFHHFSVKATRQLSYGDTILTVVQRLCFVLTTEDEQSEWNAHVVIKQHGEEKAPLPPDTVMEPLGERAPLAPLPLVSPMKLSWHYQQSSDATGELAVHIDHGLVGVPGGYEAALFFPLALARPIVHTLKGGKLLASYIDETSQSRVLVVTLPVANDETSRVSVQVEHSFVALDQLPPDAYKTYPLPAPIFRSWKPCGPPPTSFVEVEMEHDSALQLWFPARETHQQRLCMMLSRFPADGQTGLSTAVPDSAMIFNALTLGLLPCALLIGSILKLTGRFALL